MSSIQMSSIHLWKEPIITSEDSTTVSITIEFPNQTRTNLWYKIPAQYSSLITSSCEPFVLAVIFTAMKQSANLVVHGQVSPSFLRNISEFQAVWASWYPQQYKPIEITGEVEQEQLNTNSSDKVIAAFSGGVDSCFTMLRHQRSLCGRWQQNIEAGLMVHGFDIPLSQAEVFERASQRSKKMLGSLGVELIPMATNFRELKQQWEHCHGAGLASCLTLLQGGYNRGLIPSSYPYTDLAPWGSNPITDHLCSSKTFQIIHDGAAFWRIQKIQQLAHWTEALEGMRVCWQGAKKDRNCGRCHKCIRTILIFRLLGLGLPGCFEQDVTNQQILALTLKGLSKSKLDQLKPILVTAKAKNISDSWVFALEMGFFVNRIPAPLRNVLRTFSEHFAKAK